MSSGNLNYHEEHIPHWLKVLKPRAEAVSIRAIDVDRPGGVYSGEYTMDRLDQMADAARELSSRSKGVYIVMNQLSEAVCKAASNTCEPQGRTVRDADIAQRDWILIDIDPKRPANTSATHSERKAARSLCVQIQCWLD